MGIGVVFSDLDGTLVHYPKEFAEYASVVAEDESIGTASVRYAVTGVEVPCRILSSMTGGKSYISERTLSLVERIRQTGVKFAIITGARTSTYLKRRGVLPHADFECFENGSRMIRGGVVETEWTEMMEDALGPYSLAKEIPSETEVPPAEERKGKLWDMYRTLLADGWKVDARDYYANFRVDIVKSDGKNENDFANTVVPLLKPAGLSSSFNLGKADIYPIQSGKANAARHILALLDVGAEDSVALFDDDNDVELGQLCGKGYLPGITHPSVAKAVGENPHWKVSSHKGFLGTEEVLEEILSLCLQQSRTNVSL
mmetsp:Transcript_6995/g.14502  ORF Transcript_6995/g.14502 Transcript_6995/m.14502 type:complete len:315 (+) Transcript_6995:3171-4115(+)